MMFLGADGKLAGLVAVADPIKATAAEAIAKLHALGLKIVMATGDNETTAKAVAARLGIDEVRAGLRPEDKLTIIEGLQRTGRGRGDGRRRHQRRAGSGPRRCRHRHGHRRRRGHGERRADAAQRRSPRRGARRQARARHHAQHQAEPVLRLCLQRARRADRRGRALSRFRHPAVADHRRRRHELLFGVGGRQRAARLRIRRTSISITRATSPSPA